MNQDKLISALQDFVDIHMDPNVPMQERVYRAKEDMESVR